MNVVLIGRTGSGKTTMGQMLTEHLEVPFISAGDIAREMARDDPSAAMALGQGAPAPEEAMRASIRARLEESDFRYGGWVLDGFPRFVPQLVCLMQWTSELPIFVYLECTEFTCLERLTARGRTDDNPDAIARRFDSFNAHTQRVIDILDEGGVLETVDAEHRPLPEIFLALQRLTATI